MKIEDKNLFDAMGNSGYIRLFLTDVLKRAINLKNDKKINLREILKGVRFQLPPLKKDAYRNLFLDHDIFGQLINVSINILISILGDLSNNFIKLTEEIRKDMEFNNRVDEYMPYNKYAYYLLWQNLGRELEENEAWGNYKAIKVNHNEAGLEFNKIESAKFFYDLLTDYVQSGKYLRNRRV